MPELPEVETIARDLNKYLQNDSIVSIKTVNPGKILATPLASFKKAILKKTVNKIFRRAKMVVIDLGQTVVVFHLKMTGQLIFSANSKKATVAGGHPIKSTGVNVPNKFTRLIFKFKKGGTLYFNDIRKFAWVKSFTKDEFDRFNQTIGQEPLHNNFNYKIFSNLLARRKNTIIKAALLDQKLIVGLGNIYVDEVLFKAHVRPMRRVKSLSTKELNNIYKAIPIILNKAIKERGTTFSDFRDPDGLEGNFVKYLKVYGRAQKQCKNCKGPIQKTRVAGRGTHWCKNCQK